MSPVSQCFPTIRASVTERQNAVRANFDKVRSAAQEARTAYTPFMATLQELRKALQSDMSAAALTGLKPAIDNANKPDLRALLAASKTVGAALKKGDIVVYESTVYPGAIEEDCAPVLEKASKLACGRDFTLGYFLRKFTSIFTTLIGQRRTSSWQIGLFAASCAFPGKLASSSMGILLTNLTEKL